MISVKSTAAGLALTIGMASWGPVANASLVSIAFQQAGVNAGAVTTVKTGLDTPLSFSGSYGTFISISIIALGSPPNPLNDLLTSTSVALSSSTAGTLTVLITAQNIVAPLGSLDFQSTLASSTLPVGWTVAESTFLSTANALYDTLAGDLLDTNTFSATGLQIGDATRSTGPGPYSITERYVFTAIGPLSNAVSTIDVSVPAAAPPVVPEPTSLALVGLALGALGFSCRKQA